MQLRRNLSVQDYLNLRELLLWLSKLEVGRRIYTHIIRFQEAPSHSFLLHLRNRRSWLLCLRLELLPTRVSDSSRTCRVRLQGLWILPYLLYQVGHSIFSSCSWSIQSFLLHQHLQLLNVQAFLPQTELPVRQNEPDKQMTSRATLMHKRWNQLYLCQLHSYLYMKVFYWMESNR